MHVLMYNNNRCVIVHVNDSDVRIGSALIRAEIAAAP